MIRGYKTLASLCLLCIFLAACSGQSADKTLGRDLQGKQLTLNGFKGKWLVVNYWASWCKPCYEEFPELNTFFNLHHQQAAVIGVNYDNLTPVQLKQFARQQKINYPILTTDPGSQLGITEIRALPATYIFNPEGKLFKVLYGPQKQTDLEYAMGLNSTAPLLELKG